MIWFLIISVSVIVLAFYLQEQDIKIMSSRVVEAYAELHDAEDEIKRLQKELEDV